MAGERLPVNIFHGILPTAYTFLDPMDDDSKWEVPVGGTDFTGFNVGDIYGYFGQGINASVGQLAANGTYSRKRSIIASPNGNYFISINLRYGVEFINGALATSPLLMYRFWLPDASDPRAMREFIVRLSGSYVGGAAAESILSVHVISQASIVLVEKTSVFFGALAPTLLTWQPGWMRITSQIQNNSLSVIRINNVIFTPTLNLLTAPTNDPIPSATIIIQKQRNGISGDIYADTDQVSISETENRV